MKDPISLVGLLTVGGLVLCGLYAPAVCLAGGLAIRAGIYAWHWDRAIRNELRRLARPDSRDPHLW